jgi:hypothetical protein
VKGQILSRSDGDTSESTWQALTELYNLLSPACFATVDDYLETDRVGCRMAVNEFLVMKGGHSPTALASRSGGVWTIIW